MTDEFTPAKEFSDHHADGWWEYGVGGYVMFSTNEPVEPHWSPSRLAAELEAERIEQLYVVRRWVSPGVWERVDADDHPGVDDWTWSQYLEWRDAQLINAADAARARRVTESHDAEEAK